MKYNYSFLSQKRMTVPSNSFVGNNSNHSWVDGSSTSNSGVLNSVVWALSLILRLFSLQFYKDILWQYWPVRSIYARLYGSYHILFSYVYNWRYFTFFNILMSTLFFVYLRSLLRWLWECPWSFYVNHIYEMNYSLMKDYIHVEIKERDSISIPIKELNDEIYPNEKVKSLVPMYGNMNVMNTEDFMKVSRSLAENYFFFHVFNFASWRKSPGWLFYGTIDRVLPRIANTLEDSLTALPFLNGAALVNWMKGPWLVLNNVEYPEKLKVYMRLKEKLNMLDINRLMFVSIDNHILRFPDVYSDSMTKIFFLRSLVQRKILASRELRDWIASLYSNDDDNNPFELYRRLLSMVDISLKGFLIDIESELPSVNDKKDELSIPGEAFFESIQELRDRGLDHYLEFNTFVQEYREQEKENYDRIVLDRMHALHEQRNAFIREQWELGIERFNEIQREKMPELYEERRREIEEFKRKKENKGKSNYELMKELEEKHRLEREEREARKKMPWMERGQVGLDDVKNAGKQYVEDGIQSAEDGLQYVKEAGSRMIVNGLLAIPRKAAKMAKVTEIAEEYEEKGAQPMNALHPFEDNDLPTMHDGKFRVNRGMVREAADYTASELKRKVAEVSDKSVETSKKLVSHMAEKSTQPMSAFHDVENDDLPIMNDGKITVAKVKESTKLVVDGTRKKIAKDYAKKGAQPMNALHPFGDNDLPNMNVDEDSQSEEESERKDENDDVESEIAPVTNDNAMLSASRLGVIGPLHDKVDKVAKEVRSRVSKRANAYKQSMINGNMPLYAQRVKPMHYLGSRAMVDKRGWDLSDWNGGLDRMRIVDPNEVSQVIFKAAPKWILGSQMRHFFHPKTCLYLLRKLGYEKDKAFDLHECVKFLSDEVLDLIVKKSKLILQRNFDSSNVDEWGKEISRLIGKGWFKEDFLDSNYNVKNGGLVFSPSLHMLFSSKGLRTQMEELLIDLKIDDSFERILDVLPKVLMIKNGKFEDFNDKILVDHVFKVLLNYFAKHDANWNTGKRKGSSFSVIGTFNVIRSMIDYLNNILAIWIGLMTKDSDTVKDMRITMSMTQTIDFMRELNDLNTKIKGSWLEDNQEIRNYKAVCLTMSWMYGFVLRILKIDSKNDTDDWFKIIESRFNYQIKGRVLSLRQEDTGDKGQDDDHDISPYNDDYAPGSRRNSVKYVSERDSLSIDRDQFGYMSDVSQEEFDENMETDDDDELVLEITIGGNGDDSVDSGNDTDEDSNSSRDTLIFENEDGVKSDAKDDENIDKAIKDQNKDLSEESKPDEEDTSDEDPLLAPMYDIELNLSDGENDDFVKESEFPNVDMMDNAFSGETESSLIMEHFNSSLMNSTKLNTCIINNTISNTRLDYRLFVKASRLWKSLSFVRIWRYVHLNRNKLFKQFEGQYVLVYHTGSQFEANPGKEVMKAAAGIASELVESANNVIDDVNEKIAKSAEKGAQLMNALHPLGDDDLPVMDADMVREFVDYNASEPVEEANNIIDDVGKKVAEDVKKDAQPKNDPNSFRDVRDLHSLMIKMFRMDDLEKDTEDNLLTNYMTSIEDCDKRFLIEDCDKRFLTRMTMINISMNLMDREKGSNDKLRFTSGMAFQFCERLRLDWKDSEFWNFQLSLAIFNSTRAMFIESYYHLYSRMRILREFARVSEDHKKVFMSISTNMNKVMHEMDSVNKDLEVWWLKGRLPFSNGIAKNISSEEAREINDLVANVGSHTSKDQHSLLCLASDLMNKTENALEAQETDLSDDRFMKDFFPWAEKRIPGSEEAHQIFVQNQKWFLELSVDNII